MNVGNVAMQGYWATTSVGECLATIISAIIYRVYGVVMSHFI